MPKHLPAEAIRERRTCPVHNTSGPLEVIIIESWGSNPEFGIPRMCLEFLGIDVGDLTKRSYWFRSEDAEKARRHLDIHRKNL